MTINQRFEVFFPEKRPFFIENAGYFETPQNLFFSRRDCRPAGRRARHRTRGAGGPSAASSPTTSSRGGCRPDDPTLRPRRRRRSRSAPSVSWRASRTSALTFTDRELGPTANRVFGVDGRWTIDQNWTATGQWVGSTTDG